jgi:hypothetical protein
MTRTDVIVSTAAVLVVLAAPAERAQAQAFTASGTWEVERQEGKWRARLERDDDLISGTIELDGGPTRKAEIAGTFKGAEIEFGVVSAGREIASFHGVVSGEQLHGTMQLPDGATGTWIGRWGAAMARFVPPAVTRSGDPEPGFDPPARRDAQVNTDPCALVRSGGHRLLTNSAAQAVLEAACTDLSPAQASQAESVAASGTISCNPGPPESNPPTPPTITGQLANSLSRPLQVWPRITQSEPSAMVSLFQDRVAVAYNDTQFRVGTGAVDLVGIAHGSATTITQNPLQFVLPDTEGLGQWHAYSDPVAVSDGNDQFHVATVSLAVAVTVPVRGVGLSTSSNHGFSYSDVTEQGIFKDQFHEPDKEWLAIDTTTGPRSNTKYLCWTEFFADEGGGIHASIWFARRRPEDLEFRDHTQVSADLVFPDRVQGCQVTVGPDGGVYVAWWLESFGGTVSVIQLRHAADGVTFGPLRSATPPFFKPLDAAASADCSASTPGAVPALKGHIRSLPFPSLAINHQNGSLHIAYQRAFAGFGASEIAYVRSTDQGSTWSLPLVVSDGTSGDKFMPALAVSPFSGFVKVAWYDRRNDPGNISLDVYHAQSIDGGASFQTNTRLTTAMFGVPHIYPNFDCCNPPPFCSPSFIANCYMGDYNSVQGFPSSLGFYYAWGDNSLKFFDPDTGTDVPDPDVRVLAGC